MMKLDPQSKNRSFHLLQRPDSDSDVGGWAQISGEGSGPSVWERRFLDLQDAS